MNKLFIFLFTLGLIYFARFESLTFLFQKAIIPVTFLYFFFKDPRVPFNVSMVALYFLLILLAATGFVHSINIARTLRFFQLMIGSFMLLYIYIVVLSENPGLLKYILYAFIVSAVLFILTLGLSSTNIVADRRAGITSNPNLFGMFMVYAIFGVALLWKEVGIQMKIIFVGIILMSFYGIILAASRKSLISTGVFLVLWALILSVTERNIFRTVIFVGLFGVLGYFIYYEFYLNSLMMFRLEYIEDSGEGRYNIATEGFRIFKTSPLIGVGLGTFQEYSNSGKYAHNDFFELIATMGAIGLLIYLSIYYWLVKTIHVVKKHVPNKIINYKLNIFLAIIITMIVLGLGRPHFFDIFSMSIFGVLAGYTYGIGLKIHKLNEYKLLND